MRLADLKVEEEEDEDDGDLDRCFRVSKVGQTPETKTSLMEERVGWSRGSSFRRLSRENRNRSSFWKDSCIRA